MQNEGYDIDIINGYLIVRHVPYVNERHELSYGILVSDLDLANNVTIEPKSHVARWAGDYPYFKDGRKMESLVNAPDKTVVNQEIVTKYLFSQKPQSGHYDDYYAKVTTYIRILESQAEALDGNATARIFPVIKYDDVDKGVFCYIDTSSSRSGITSVTRKLESSKIGIVGLGGTGSYILDLVAKTPVLEIHLFDGDYFLQHNAFRSPGAPSSGDIERRIKKVTWFSELYSRIRRNIFPHDFWLDASNLDNLNSLGFVFLCVDRGSDRRLIIDYLSSHGIPFIDTGIGVHFESEDTLGGQVRITTFTNGDFENIKRRIPIGDDADNEYSSNIQIAELNSLSASLAVIKWKKLLGFYSDSSMELSTSYMITENLLINEEIRNETEKV